MQCRIVAHQARQVTTSKQALDAPATKSDRWSRLWWMASQSSMFARGVEGPFFFSLFFFWTWPHLSGSIPGS